MSDTLEQIQRLDDQCVEANIEENDYTIYSADDLSFDFGLLEQALQKKSAFISNQVWEEKMAHIHSLCLLVLLLMFVASCFLFHSWSAQTTMQGVLLCRLSVVFENNWLYCFFSHQCFFLAYFV